MTTKDHRQPLGAEWAPDGTTFSVLTSPGRTCLVRLFDGQGGVTAEHPLVPEPGGVARVTVARVPAGALYKLVVDGQELPDPYARFLPQGVHGPAMVVDPAFPWRSPCISRPLREHVMYELHVGTFTDEGTYDSAAERLQDLVDLGITAIELMPLASFPGTRGWGYDGVALFAPFAGYGTPRQLRDFVDRAHAHGLAVFLDVVYNHLGPDGNYLRSYSPDYFNPKEKNAWGDAPDYGRSAMRRLVLSNALYWLREFRFDGLRLDATHAIFDHSPEHILKELAEAVATLSPRRLLIAEDERNEPTLITELGLDGLWADDFHHAMRVTLTRERDGYFAGYDPGTATVGRTITSGWLYQGEIYAPSGRRRGKPADQLQAEQLVYCIQNHDQIGNRAFGDRLTASVPIEAYAAASMVLLFVPMTPLLFMGQEWAASSPFQYFTDHNPELGRLVSQGRREEFKSFAAFEDPARRAQIPDPQALETFERCKLRWSERGAEPHRAVLELYKSAIALRRDDPVLRDARREELEVSAIGEVLVVRRWKHASVRHLLANLSDKPVPLALLPTPDHARLLLSSDGRPLGDRLGAWRAVVLANES